MNATESKSGSRAAMNSQERAYKYIKDEIIGYRLKPNERLTAASLASVLNISRTPVREALSRLEQERLVVRESGWGYVVRPMTFADVANIFRVREALEVEAANEALPNLGDGAADFMTALLVRAEELLTENEVSEFLRINRQFHNTFAEHSGNWVLQDMLQMITDRIQIVGALVIDRYPQRAVEILQENKRILAAVRSKDANLVDTELRAHIRRARECVSTFFKQESRHFYLGDGARYPV